MLPNVAKKGHFFIIEKNGQNIKFFYFLYFYRVLRLKLHLLVDFHEKEFYWSRSNSILVKSDIFAKKASALA